MSSIFDGIAALVSLYTAIALTELRPKALTLSSSAELEVTNRELEQEISEQQAVLCGRKQAKLALQECKALLRRIR